ncbi:MAG: TraB/GumN family protein [Bacteroidota bacterium]|nr:TraB/GumN family protein [Bacteroidota bacterium]
MRKGCTLLLAFLTLLATSIAQVPKEKTLLWQVSGKGILKPSYLFGTIHLMCTDQLKVPDLVKETFGTTSQLFLEVDLDDPNIMQQMMAGMQMKDSSTLETLMGNSFEKVDAVFKNSTGMPLKMLNTAKPLLIMSMLYPSLLGCTPVSWETVFETMAKDKSMEIKGLEKLQDQMDVFEKIPYKVQADMLVKTLLNVDSAKAEFQKMLEVYKNKDIDQLNILTAKEEDFGEYQDVLLINRNRKWIPVIGGEAKKTSTFFAFGAGHLGGETGIINLLRKSGFTVKPVFYK